MFICGICKKFSKLREKPMTKTVKERAVLYPPRSYTDPSGRTHHDPGGAGMEIVQEILVHSSCNH